jgi:predicted nucleic acid-binding protein
MKRVLLDVNVVLDVLLDRQPHAEGASQVWAAVERGEVEGFLSAHAVTTIHYLNQKTVGARTAREATDALLSVFDVAPVDRGVLHASLSLGCRDFEDGVMAAAARRAKCDVIVTRNTRDFRQSPVRALTPSEALAMLGVTG